MATIQGMTQRLVMRGELLKLFGVSSTRLVQITSQPEHGFPAPLATLSGGKVWDLDEVEAWASERGRTLTPLDAE